MKRFLSLFICIILLISLCACGENTNTNTSDSQNETTSVDTNNNEVEKAESTGEEIIGTWVCDDINKDCYFIFDEKGDAYAKWGTCTVYGYYDYFSDENLYDIDVNGFLYNEYKATFSGDEMKLESEDSSFSFEKATMPEVTIKAPDDLKTDKKIIGDWQSPQSYECYRFNDDNTAVITDLMSEATIDCKYTCVDNTITLFYMSSDKKDGSRELSYTFDGKLLILDGYEYEKVA